MEAAAHVRHPASQRAKRPAGLPIRSVKTHETDRIPMEPPN